MTISLAAGSHLTGMTRTAAGQPAFNCTAAIRRRVGSSDDRPGPEDVAHLVRFCLQELGAG
ncbi:hypothetical protein ACOJVU_19300 [Mycobacterium sp. THU-M104]|uniref:hypothetical protein n=1 Tax=Mycobacterium sp. THU-M104 TaxID=3410515 RepID=UPI003B99A3BA